MIQIFLIFPLPVVVIPNVWKVPNILQPVKDKALSINVFPLSILYTWNYVSFEETPQTQDVN